MNLSPVVGHWVSSYWDGIMIREGIGIVVLHDMVIHNSVLCWWIVVSRSWCDGALVMDSSGVFVPSVVVVIIVQVLSAVVVTCGLRGESAVSNDRSLVRGVIVVGFMDGVSGDRCNVDMVRGGGLLSSLGLLLLVLLGGLSRLLVHLLLLHALVVDGLDVMHDRRWVVDWVDDRVVNWVHYSGVVDRCVVDRCVVNWSVVDRSVVDRCVVNWCWDRVRVLGYVMNWLDMVNWGVVVHGVNNWSLDVLANGVMSGGLASYDSMVLQRRRVVRVRIYMMNRHVVGDRNDDVRSVDMSRSLLLVIVVLLGRLGLLFRLRCLRTVLVRLSNEWVVHNVMNRRDMVDRVNDVMVHDLMDSLVNVMNGLNNMMHGNNLMNRGNVHGVNIVVNIGDVNNLSLLVLLLFVIGLMRLLVLGVVCACTAIIVVHLEDEVTIVNICLAAHEER